ncbi:hypothetical protein ABE10_02465 [Bacillus toyonensis]|nr:hypothetical protein [Bacillus toyonensis]
MLADGPLVRGGPLHQHADPGGERLDVSRHILLRNGEQPCERVVGIGQETVERCGRVEDRLRHVTTLGTATDIGMHGGPSMERGGRRR